ncbi:hypothetical protein M413DRAFT_199340 [Hebeloma cylindrosporum]|uniref:Uncharacterized protein n=1 Tax=Hebeloma cylindrosporum TaxID=76867 RepID=A0A0C3CF82_HEBCY|nr:hypothetical protein M413DRAFT_199340 [Hebeloma cylindrosporum h7]
MNISNIIFSNSRASGAVEKRVYLLLLFHHGIWATTTSLSNTFHNPIHDRNPLEHSNWSNVPSSHILWNNLIVRRHEQTRSLMLISFGPYDW